MRNSLSTVAEVRSAFETMGVTLDLFGGWAEELLDLRAPGLHRDIDFVCRSEDFAAVDSALETSRAFEESRTKRFRHKRAFLHRGVLCEILLVRGGSEAPFSLFWGDVRFSWHAPLLHPSLLATGHGPMSVVSPANLRKYRAEFAATQNHRWRDAGSIVP